MPSGTTQGVAIQVGSDTVSLTFDKAARLLIKGQAGKRVGFQSPGSSTFTEIATVCGADDQATVDAQMDALHVNECKINVGSDLVVWTRHFTTFVTFSVTPGSGSSSSSTTTSSTSSTQKKAVVASTATSNGVESAASVLGIASGTSSDATKHPATTNNSTDKDKDASSNFLGLGWWWLLVLAVVAALSYLAVVRRADR